MRTLILILLLVVSGCDTPSYASPIVIKAYKLQASWYSIASLKKEGTFKTSKGVMTNGHSFSDSKLTCATRLFPLGSILLVTNTRNHKHIKAVVTDRIGKRFAKTRIDLSREAFKKIANLEEGIVPVIVVQI